MTKERIKPMEAIKIGLQSAKYFLMYYDPLARKNPPLHMGKTEAVAMTMAFNVLGITEKNFKQNNSDHILTAFISFTNLCKIYDQVVDDKFDNSNQLTADIIDNTPVEYKYFKKEIKAQELIDIIENSFLKAFPNNQEKRENLKSLVLRYRDRVIENANNQDYAVQGEVLDFEHALKSKIEVSQFLGEIAADIFSKAYDIQDPVGINLYGKACLAVQFGDDLVDWKIDELKKGKRPKENLFLATLKEFPEEQKLVIAHINDNLRSAKLIHKYAPEAIKEYKRRFSLILEEFPNHSYSSKTKDIISFALNILEPNFNDKGRVAKWGDIQ